MSRPIFFQCVVINNKDPLMLGRVRARIRTENYEDIIKGVENWNEQTDPSKRISGLDSQIRATQGRNHLHSREGTSEGRCPNTSG